MKPRSPYRFTDNDREPARSDDVAGMVASVLIVALLVAAIAVGA